MLEARCWKHGFGVSPGKRGMQRRPFPVLSRAVKGACLEWVVLQEAAGLRPDFVN